jgi:SAM-dependent methyltransferase
MQYHQTHSEFEEGQTDSSRKFNRLKIPNDLTNKSFLDIGCNEGFFCNKALINNAQSVVGIDFDEKFINEAIRRYPDERAEYYLKSWADLPDKKFDVIVWASAMHYELDPITILKNIKSRMTPEGLFILECGVVFNSEKNMNYAIRSDNGHWYPTKFFIEKGLNDAGLSFRLVSQPEKVGLDPVPRVVYHCKHLLPTVLLIVGNSGAGKSSLAHQLSNSASKIYSLDLMLSRIAHSEWAHSPLEKFIKNKYNPLNLGNTYIGIDTENLTGEFVDFLIRSVAASDQLVIFEGFLTDTQVEKLVSALEPRSKVWIVR